MRRLPAVAVLVLLAAVATFAVGGVADATTSVDGDWERAAETSGDTAAAWSAAFAQGEQNSTEESEDAAAQRAAVISGERLVQPCAAEPPSDYGAPDDADALGWENGVWYDEPLQIENATELTTAERDAVVARTAARVEALRCLEFEAVPPVEVVNRSTMTARQRAQLANRSAASERFDDARLEAALLLGTDEDPVAARAETTGGAARAVYDPETQQITLLAADDGGASDGAAGDDGSSGPENGSDRSETGTAIDEVTLAHELVHALQDQAFGLSSFDSQRTDEALGEAGLLEGDAVLIEHWYEDRCGSSGWNATCVRTDAPSTSSSGSAALNLLLFQPYNDGPMFVEHVFEASGWSAVNERYERPPTSSYQVLNPGSLDTYERPFVPIDVTVARGWERLRPPDSPANDVVGPGAIAAALLSPTFEPGGDVIYSPERIQRSGGRAALGRHQVYDYSVDAVRGWQGDRLIAYENEGGETASIWASSWSSSSDADLFERRYEALLDVRGAESVDDLRGTYRFSESSSYDGAVYVAATDDTVTVVHGPDVEALRTLHASAARTPESPFEGHDVGSGPAANVTADQLPGLSIVVAVVVLLVVAVAVRRSERYS